MELSEKYFACCAVNSATASPQSLSFSLSLSRSWMQHANQASIKDSHGYCYATRWLMSSATSFHHHCPGVFNPHMMEWNASKSPESYWTIQGLLKC